jgi:WD40 repeat protein
MKISHDALAGTVIIGLVVAAGVWYAQDPECQQWPLSCLGTGTKKSVAAMPRVAVTEIAWSADGMRLLARFRCHNDSNPRLVLLCVAQPGSRFEFDSGGDVPACTVLAAEANRVLVATWQGRLWWLNADDLEVATPPVELPISQRVTAAAIAPEGRLIAAGTDAGRIWLCDPVSRSQTSWQAPERSSFRSLRFGRDGKRVLSAQNTGRMIVWDVASGVILQEFAGHPHGGAAAEFLGDGQRIISGGLDDTVRIWDIDSGRELWRGEFGMYGVHALAVSADGKTAAWGGFNRKLVVWDLDLHRKKREIAIPATCVHTLQFSPDGTTLAAAGRDESIRLFDVGTGAETGRIEVASPERL